MELQFANLADDPLTGEGHKEFVRVGSPVGDVPRTSESPIHRFFDDLVAQQDDQSNPSFLLTSLMSVGIVVGGFRWTPSFAGQNVQRFWSIGAPLSPVELRVTEILPSTGSLQSRAIDVSISRSWGSIPSQCTDQRCVHGHSRSLRFGKQSAGTSMRRSSNRFGATISMYACNCRLQSEPTTPKHPRRVDGHWQTQLDEDKGSHKRRRRRVDLCVENRVPANGTTREWNAGKSPRCDLNIGPRTVWQSWPD